ncbi:GAF domain-containing sensor histidine kinase [Nocardioides sp. TF02-7]|uniref:sensor histidine kinase n=1 Tax=Nocardioides sp. TF02-7 TaxID=2917724 RepID=UPI001F05AA34|nr:GAF domain-containing sensor histidine kinase [Nocardioides sp. TF02-7]UMG91388.1 GAF domain-containing sensor histidine kinase [Nocardioides sp. TF02-7]
MRETLLRSGRLGRDLLSVDWAETPIGPPEEWPPLLRSTVRTVLASRFPMWLAWGPSMTFFCNDAYREVTLGAKYPWALGRPAATVWSEIWDDIGPRIEQVFREGVSTWDEKLMLVLERSGYPEETYHTFSYSPVADDDGEVAAMLCVVSEDTDEVIANRRIATLAELAGRIRAQVGEQETIRAAGEALAAGRKDLPFHLLYLHDGSGAAQRVGIGGLPPEHPAAPAVVPADGEGGLWTAGAPDVGPTVVDLDPERFPDLPTGAWPVPPSQAAVVPVPGAQGAAYGFLVAGLNPYRPFDAEYADFLTLVGGQLGAAITDARAYEAERQRAESLAALDRAKSDFFTNVSHEFRTPLTLLLGPAEDALADSGEPLPPRQRDRVELVQRNGLRLLKLVNTLLDFSRLESGRMEGTFEPVDLAAYTRQLAGMFSGAAERLGLTLVVDCPPLDEEVHVDRDLWGKVVLNLLSNALKFTHEGSITVRLGLDGPDAVLTVRDTGVGIPRRGAVAAVRAVPPDPRGPRPQLRGVRDRPGPRRRGGRDPRWPHRGGERAGRGQRVLRAGAARHRPPRPRARGGRHRRSGLRPGDRGVLDRGGAVRRRRPRHSRRRRRGRPAAGSSSPTTTPTSGSTSRRSSPPTTTS